MPPFQFRPNVRYRNEQKLDGSYGHIHVPSGVSARMPYFASAEKMNQIAAPRLNDGVYTDFGLTDALFSVAFTNLAQQWVPVRLGGPTRWQFTGGVIVLDILISVYVLDGFQRYKLVVGAILEHEFLHVLDAIDMVSKFVPKAALKDAYVENYLTKGQDLDDLTYRKFFAGPGFQDRLRNEVWNEENNRRIDARDKGAAAERYRQRVDELHRTSH